MKVRHGKVDTCDYIDQKSIIDFNQFEGTIWTKYNTMEQCHNYDFGLKGEEILKKKTDNALKSNKYQCNQCDYASSHVWDRFNPLHVILWIFVMLWKNLASNLILQIFNTR